MMRREMIIISSKLSYDFHIQQKITGPKIDNWQSFQIECTIVQQQPLETMLQL